MTAAGRRPLVVGNWKMNLGEGRATALVDDLLPRLPAGIALEVAVAPPFVSLRAVRDRIAGTPVLLAAQNAHWEDKGAFTGEVAPPMLAEIGVRMVLIGHSERRTLFGETDESVARKVAAVLRHGMAPILCVGERLAERDEGRTFAVIERQIRAGLAGIDAGTAAPVVVAYEPVWAIGTGRTATPEQAQEVHRLIRETLSALFTPEAAARTRILYGGSVTPATAPGLLALPDVDGALVGGASLDAGSFAAIALAALS